ncbi:MAG TPA: lysine--tRNA ligase [Rubrobacter sp.]|jgi:lysyl-tRNA synthetase class 1|nr:lysine--tRNA ligase [Rubrobacter sp.]
MSETGRSTGIHIPGWANRVADSLGAGPHVVVSGISVSGNIHAGNLREVLVAEAVANALRQRGEEVRFIFHADTIDPLRKIAPGVPESYEQYIGHSLSHIPDPEGCHVSYAEHFLVPFEEALREMEMDVEVLRSHELYERGVYTGVTSEAIEHTDELREILQDVTNRKMPEHWSPYLPRAASGKLTGMRVLEHLPEQTSVVFADEDGWQDSADYSRGEGKLGWRVELAARWKALGVTFEPFGKDHTSRGGSTDTADRMSREVFHYPVPGRYEYEWIGLKGRGDMSSSRGIVLLPEDLLRIMPPGAVRRIILGRDPARRFDIDLEGGFPRFMDEYRAETGQPYVPFTHLVTVAQTVGVDTDAAAQMLGRGGYEEAIGYGLANDLYYARNWAAEWAPESMRVGLLDPAESEQAAAALDDEQREYLREVSAKLQAEMDAGAIQDVLYSTAIERGLKPKKAFAAVYRVLLGKTSGPKAGPFIAGLGPDQVSERFSV